MTKRTTALAMLVLPLLFACEGGPSESTLATAAAQSRFDSDQVLRGGRLFAQHCAQCHGDQAQGAVNWRQRDPDGKFPPPPLDGTGHAWHHPKPMLHYVIKNGSPGGQGNMPAWRDRLSDQEVDDIIVWFQSKWPEEVYAAWTDIDGRAGR